TGLQALKLFDALNDKAGMADTYLLLALTYKDIGGDKILEEYVIKGLEYSKQAYRLHSQANDTAEMASDLNASGIIYRDRGHQPGKEYYYDSAYNCYIEAIRLIEQSDKGTQYLGKLYNNMSNVYTEYRKDYNGALGYLFKAVAFNKRSNNINSLSYNYG